MPQLATPSPEIRAISNAFRVNGELIGVAPWAGGHINDSYLLEFLRMEGRRQFLLQRVNSVVFPKPEAVMENVARVTHYVAERAPGLAFLELIPTWEEHDWFTDQAGDCWRLYPFIEGTVAHMEPENAEQVEAAAQAYGHFTRILANLPAPPLNEVIPDFHNTPLRIATLNDIVKDDPFGKVKDVQDELEFIRAYTGVAGLICDHLESGELPWRVVHNDTKISNVLFEEKSDEAICVVDLDTVMPGSALFDVGDMLRSMCSSTKEDEANLANFKINPDYCDAILRGFARGAGNQLSDLEREFMPHSGVIIALELGVRFLSDYLSGDQYFKTSREGQNLDRARVQLAIAAELRNYFKLAL